MSDTTWKQDALSRPLRRDRKPEADALIWTAGQITQIQQLVSWIVPGGLIEEHDGRIVDQLEGDGQSFTLTSREAACPSLSTFKETQSGQDLVHLTDKQGFTKVSRSEPN